MKKITLALTLVLSCVIIFIACNKNQKVVNQLDGTWKIEGVTEDGKAQPTTEYENTTYKFEKCKVKKGDCPGTVTEDGKALAFTYRISDDGEKLTMNVLGQSATADIIENSKTRFKYRSTDSKGVVTETTLTKI